jgi:hypothetical protein
MASLLLLPPTVLDQSFPRNIAELNHVSDALAEIQSLIERQVCRVIVTDVISDFLAEFDWQHAVSHSALHDIYNLLAAIVLRGGDASIRVRVDYLAAPFDHPLPRATTPSPVSARWQAEAGKLLAKHTSMLAAGRWCVGVPCESAFAGGACGDYDNPNNFPHFPLLSPDSVSQLTPCYEYIVRNEDVRTPVTFSLAKKHIHLLGGKVHKPSGGSHHRVTFVGARTWVLDPNDDPVPEAYLSQLTGICGTTLHVIKHTLLHGAWPELRFVFQEIVVAPDD